MTRLGRRALGPALVLFAQHTAGVSLGDIEVRSALGEPLEARIPLTLVEGETIDASCFTLARSNGNEAMPQLAEATLTVQTVGAAAALRVRSAARLFEPAIAVRIRAACAGEPPAERQYVLLLDPRPDTAGVESLAVVGATLNSRPGDSLQSLAAQVFPNERAPRVQLLEALREMNPQLASNAAGAVLPEGTPVILPDLREFAKAKPRRQPPARRGPQEVATPKAAAAPKERGAPKERVVPPPSSVATSAQAPKAVTPPARAVTPAPTAATPTPKAVPRAGTGFVLKLSSGEVDMSRTRGIDDRKRQQLRERQLVLDSDDQVAALLALRNSMKQLESRVADLQLKLAQMPASLAARSESAATAPAAAKAPPPAPPRLEAPKALPPRIETTRIEAARAAEPAPAPAMTAAPRIEIAKVEPPAPPPVSEAPKAAPVEEAKPAPVEVPKPAPKAAPTEAPKTVSPPVAKAAPPRSAEGFDGPGLASNPLLWAAILALAATVLGVIAWRRRAARPIDEKSEAGDVTMIAEPAFDDEQKMIPPRDLRSERPAMASDAGLSTRLPDNSRELRRRYIEERFPEIPIARSRSRTRPRS